MMNFTLSCINGYSILVADGSNPPLPLKPSHQTVQRRVLDHRRPHHPSPAPRQFLYQTRPGPASRRRRFRPLLRHAQRQQRRLQKEARERRLQAAEAGHGRR